MIIMKFEGSKNSYELFQPQSRLFQQVDWKFSFFSQDPLTKCLNCSIWELTRDNMTMRQTSSLHTASTFNIQFKQTLTFWEDVSPHKQLNRLYWMIHWTAIL